MRGLIVHCACCAGQALATTLDENELQQLRDQFDAMDINKDGTITLDEIRYVSPAVLCQTVLDTCTVWDIMVPAGRQSPVRGSNLSCSLACPCWLPRAGPEQGCSQQREGDESGSDPESCEF